MWCVSDHWATRTPRAFIKTWASGLVLCLSYLWWHHFSNRLAKCFNPWTSREGIGGAEDLPVLAALLLMHSWYNRKTYSSQQKSTRATTVRKLKSLLINWGYEQLIPPLINTSLEKGDVMHLEGCDDVKLSEPPCSVGFAATSTSSSERLSLLRSSSWCTGISSASGLCHGSPTSLITTQTHNTFNCMLRITHTRDGWLQQEVGFLNCGYKMIPRWPQLFNFTSKNAFHRSSKGFSCLTVRVDYVSSGASNPDGSCAAPAVLTLGKQQSPSAGTWIPCCPPEHCGWQFPATYRSAISLPPLQQLWRSTDAVMRQLWHRLTQLPHTKKSWWMLCSYYMWNRPQMCMSSSPKEAACSRQFPSPVVARGSSFLQLVHMVDHQFRRPARNVQDKEAVNSAQNWETEGEKTHSTTFVAIRSQKHTKIIGNKIPESNFIVWSN